MKHDWLEPLLGRPGRDPGCDIGFAQLDHGCDAVRRGEDVERQFPDLVRHIQNCPACREDTEGLLAALEGLEE
jgi:hypothetical protein